MPWNQLFNLISYQNIGFASITYYNVQQQKHHLDAKMNSSDQQMLFCANLHVYIQVLRSICLHLGQHIRKQLMFSGEKEQQLVFILISVLGWRVWAFSTYKRMLRKNYPNSWSPNTWNRRSSPILYTEMFIHPTRWIVYSASFSRNPEGHFWRCVRLFRAIVGGVFRRCFGF